MEWFREFFRELPPMAEVEKFAVKPDSQNRIELEVVCKQQLKKHFSFGKNPFLAVRFAKFSVFA